MSNIALSYQQLAFEWSPDGDKDSRFHKITAITVALMLLIGAFISIIPLPEEKRRLQQAVPERVAKFILEQEKPKPKPKPQPKPKPKPIVRVLKKAPKQTKPLSKEEKKARQKAESSGVLALANELSDLMDTSAVDAMVGVKTNRSSAAANQIASYSQDLLTAGSSEGSSGVNAAQYTSSRSQTQLSQRELTLVKQALVSGKIVSGSSSSKFSGKRGGNTGRNEEELTVMFDRNKGSLYSVYNRARRKNPGLKGKVVIEITIAPDGSVTRARIVSSELGDKALEASLLRRIKTFKFEAKNVKSITVTYPIEFLPS